MKSYLMLLLLLLAGMLFCMLSGFIYTTWRLDRQISRCGAYPTLEDAIEADWKHNGLNPAWFNFNKSQNSEHTPWTWYIIVRVRPEYASAVEQAPKPEYYCGGSFYHHTRQGWVGMPEGIWNALGFMDENMRVFHLYGE